MRKRNASVLSQVLLSAVLGIGLTACSSPEQDAEVREEPEVATTAQDEVQVDAIEGDTHEDGDVHEIEDDMTDDDVEVMQGNELETNDVDAVEGVEADESESIDADGESVGNIDDDDIIDGTEQEEHLSTY